MYRFVLFDLDGTLTDSREGIFNSVRYSLDKLGRPCPPYETLLRFVGPPLHDSFERYCGMDAQESHRAVNVFRERYETIGWAENKAAPGMVELMRCLISASAAYICLLSEVPVLFSCICRYPLNTFLSVALHLSFRFSLILLRLGYCILP